MMLGEIVFGGVGAGMYGIVVFIILTVFIAGLMVGRTPEYLGKKIEAYDVKMAMLAVLIFSLLILIPAILIYIKRWHDRDKSGWWNLILLIPIVGAIWFLVELGFLKGTPGPNRFGPPVTD